MSTMIRSTTAIAEASPTLWYWNAVWTVWMTKVVVRSDQKAKRPARTTRGSLRSTLPAIGVAALALAAAVPAHAGTLLDQPPKLYTFKLDDPSAPRLGLLRSYLNAEVESPGPLRRYIWGPFGQWRNEPWWQLAWGPARADGDATVTGVRVARMRLGAPDVTGRQTPEEIPDADYTEPAELVIKALGFEPEELPRLWGVKGLEVTRWGTVKADFLTKRTSLEGVYAAGDIVRGASLVVWAIRDGREAAESIMGWLDSRAAVAAE